MRLRLNSLILSLLLVIGLAPAAQGSDTRYLDVAQITWSGAKTPEVTSADVVDSIQS